MDNGWIKIHRKITENSNYLSEQFCRNMAWIDLIILANHKEGYYRLRGQRVTVLRGQIGHSSENLARRWRWSRGKVLRFLNELEKDGMIVQQKNSVISLISILNYNMYQSGSTTDGTTNSTAYSTTDGQQTVQQTDTNKNVKKNKNVKNNTFMSFDNDDSKLYFTFLESVDNSDLNKVFLALKGFINENNPKYPNPYVDLWNLFANKYGLARVGTLSDTRLQKLRGRINDSSFDFPAIMLKISKSSFYKGETGSWKVDFDYVIKNDTNFLKILENAS